MPDTVQQDQILQVENGILASVAQGSPLETIFNRIIESLEFFSGDVIGSILELDQETRQLHVVSAPHLPEAYNQAIDGVEIGDGVGSCGTAAYRGEAVVVEDILHHPFWADFKDLAEEHGLRACWSTPILSSDHQVLGTFACYYKEPKLPSDGEWELMVRLGHIASIVMERESDQHLLKEMAEMDQAIVENATDAILVITENGEILKTNPKCRELFGYQESEFQALNIQDLVADRSKDARPLPTKLIHADPHVEVQQWFKPKSQQEFQAALNASALPNNHILLMVRDHRRRPAMEKQRGPDQTVQALMKMAICVTDELKQSLTAIISHRDLLADQLSASSHMSETSQDSLKQILEAAKRANGVTQQLNAFSQQIPFELKTLSLTPFLGELLLELRNVLGSECTIDFRVGRGVTTLHADPAQLKSALQQLLRFLNFVDGLPQQIALSASQNPEGETVTLSIEVTAPSVWQMEPSRAFEPFLSDKAQRLETALGLSTVRGIITQMGGRIELKRTHDQQVQFNIILPTHSTPATPATTKPEIDRPSAGEEVLVCEDNEAIRLAVEGLLRASGYQVHAVKNGIEALEYANRSEKSTALLISDIRMPGMSGKELAIKIREQHPNTQIILISGHTGGLVTSDWLASENITFLQKPFTHSALVGAVSKSFCTYRSMLP